MTREQREAIYRRHAEMQVIQHAIKSHRGCAPETCGGSTYDPCQLANSIEDLQHRYSRIGGLAAAFESESADPVRQLDDDGPVEDPLSGELIPATRDEDLERQGREIAEGRQHLADQLREIAQGTMQEWMRFIDIDTPDIALTGQARVRWQNDDGECIVGESPYGEEYGRFRITVSVQDLGPMPPIGPENDPAQIAEMEERPQWYARTMSDVRPGDRILPGVSDKHDLKPEGFKVTARCWPPTDDARGRGSWHVIEGSDGHWSDHVVQPGECCVHLDGAGHRLFRPTFAVEILLAPSEMQAIELLGGWENRERMITE